MASKKINITLQEDLLERMDTYASENALSRSALIALSVSQYLNAVEAMPSLNKLLTSMAAVAEGTLKGEIVPAEAESRLKQIQSSYEVLIKK